MSNAPQGGNQRRHPRKRVAWPVTVQAEDRRLHGETLDVGPQGAKLRLKGQLEVGTRVTLHVSPPGDGPMAIQAIVWRVDKDGTVFFFLSTEAASAEQGTNQKGTGVPSQICTETILVVDDEADVLDVAADALEGQGYTVLKTQDPIEALRLVRTSAEPIQLLLTDVVMPVMHGVKLADEVRAIRPSVKVLFMSAYTTEQIEDYGAVLLPGVSLLIKPFALPALYEKVRSVLDYRSPFARSRAV